MAFVGRQPILRSDLTVVGYELLFRSGDENRALVEDGDFASASVMLNSLAEIGLDVATDSKIAFINVTRNLLLNGDLSCLPHQRIVLEVLEDIEPDEVVLDAIRRLVQDGFTIALDDLVYRPELEPLIELADIVKIEFPQIPADQLESHVNKLRQLGVKTILAEKLETCDDFEICKKLGCDLFQGYFFCRPQILKQPKVQSNIGVMVHLLSRLQDPDLTIREVESVVQMDANLSYKVLRFVNSADVATRSVIQSLSHAMTLLGVRRLRSLASMMLLASIGSDVPHELITTAMIRARLCESLAKRARYKNTERFYTIGLLSVLDALLGQPIEEVIKLLPLSDEMNNALVRHEGKLGNILKKSINVESKEKASAEISAAYHETLKWVADNRISQGCLS